MELEYEVAIVIIIDGEEVPVDASFEDRDQ